jgi:hypothetical protein
MGLLALVSVLTTSATVIVFGKAIWDPVQLAGDIGGVAVVVGLLIISLDTVCCNIAANLVGTGLRLLGLVAQQDQLSDRRLDHGRHRRADHALEAAGDHPGLHLHLAGRLRRAAWDRSPGS